SFAAVRACPWQMRGAEAETCSGAERLPSGNRLRLSLRRDRRGLAIFDHRAGGPLRRLADENAVDGRGRLPPCGGVDDVARGHALAELRSGPESHERLAR